LGQICGLRWRKNKFDKLANKKKDTGNPSCPPEVRRAKHIARDILGSCYAGSAGDSDAMEPLPPAPPVPPIFNGGIGGDGESNEGGGSGGGGGTGTNYNMGGGGGGAVSSGRRSSPMGSRVRLRAVAAGGVGKKKSKDPLVASVEQVAANMAEITKAITAPAPANLQALVREEVEKAMEENTKKLDEIKKFIVELANK